MHAFHCAAPYWPLLPIPESAHLNSIDSTVTHDCTGINLTPVMLLGEAHPINGAVHESVWSLLLVGGSCQLGFAPFSPAC